MTPSDTKPQGDARDELRARIVTEIMGLVRKPAVRVKPTIEELERILNSENPPDMQIDPDGTILSTPQSHTTVGDIADAILKIIDPLLSRIPGEEATEPTISEVFEAFDDKLPSEIQRIVQQLAKRGLRITRAPGGKG